MKFEPEEIVWDVLPEALGFGREAELAYQQTKSIGALPNGEQRRRDHQKRLRVVEPW